MKIIVTGGRGYADKEFLFTVLDRLHNDLDFTFVIHGAAAGADSLAGQWARERGVQEVVCPANWHKHSRRAGYLRNTAMADLVKGDEDVALVHFPGGVGTNMMVEIAEERGMTVINASDYRR
jgi:hypothetical protein